MMNQERPHFHPPSPPQADTAGRHFHPPSPGLVPPCSGAEALAQAPKASATRGRQAKHFHPPSPGLRRAGIFIFSYFHIFIFSHYHINQLPPLLPDRLQN